MSKMNLKGPNHLDMLICLIEQKESKHAETLIETYPELLEKKCKDGNEAIYFAIRHQNNKIFKMMLNKRPLPSSHNLPKMLNAIIDSGTAKMLKFFISHFKISLQSPCYEPYVRRMIESGLKFHQFLLYEQNFPFCFSVLTSAFESMGYNCPTYEFTNLSQQRKMIFINKYKNTFTTYEIDKYFDTEEKKKRFIFYRYRKFFLVMKKSNKLPKNIKETVLREIVKYI